jgi:hypothetical protein
VKRSGGSGAERIYDEYGNEIRGEVRTETLCELQQRHQAEEGDVLGVGDFILFLPPDTPLDTNDGVIVGGLLYEVMGPPWYARNPRTGQAHHVEANLRRTGGEEVLA